MEAFPNAKVILSVRDPKKWYLSVKNTIRYGQSVYSSFPVNILMELIGKRKTVNMIIHGHGGDGGGWDHPP